MEKKSMIFNAFLAYAICQILCNVYFLVFGNTLRAQYTFWLLTINGSIFWGVKFFKCKCSQVFNFQKSKLVLIRILLCFQILSILYLICFLFAPELEVNSILTATFALFHLPEYILSQFVEEIIYILENTSNFNISMTILNHLYSTFSLTAVVIFIELYMLSTEKECV